jgi:hypothetical protein
MKTCWTMIRRSALVKQRGGALAALLLVCVGFTAPRTAAAPAAEPCATNASARQLDFWVGEWKISDGENPATATSKVSLELGKCLVVENWSDPAGNRGKNFFGYNLDDKTWGGMFADTRGQVHIFVRGTVAKGKAVFYGPSRGPGGRAMLNRITIVRLASGKVEQTWEKSGDNGGTWKTEFRGEYLRQE